MKRVFLSEERKREMEAELKCVLLHEGAKVPTKGSSHAAGFDLCYAPMIGDNRNGLDIHEGQRVLVPTGVAVSIPVGYYGRIAPRSGLAVKEGIDILAGVVDPDYSGQIMVVLVNTTRTWPSRPPFHISPGDRIAQLIIEKIHPCNNFTVVEKLDETQRGTGGFGSTGK